jgi:choline dehydrogenase-like flavoprotein
MEDCDTLLVVGSSFPYSEFLPREGQARGVQIDRDARMIGLRYPMAVDRASIAYAKRTLRRVWDAAGAQDTLAIDRYAHLIGGARIGHRPEDSVCDADHRVWALPNLFVADGSALPTQGAANPALTIMATGTLLHFTA